MSLDVYLVLPESIACPHCGGSVPQPGKRHVFDSNVTHNLAPMAEEAGIYKALWRPEEIGVKTAADLIPYLAAGLLVLRNDPAHFGRFNPKNGWGSYEGFVPWVQSYLDACREFPAAEIEVSR